MDNSIQRTLADGTATVTVRGDIDFANHAELAQCIRDAIAEWTPAIVRVNLREAAFIDTSGVGALIEGYRAAIDAGATFVVAEPTAAFRRELDVTGLSELFGLAESAATETRATGA